MSQEDDDHWTIRIPKPKRLMRRIVAYMAGFAESKISVDVPMMIMTALFIGVISFIIFNLFVRIPDIISLAFSAILVIIYIAAVASRFRQ